MSANEIDQIKERYTQFANTLAEVSEALNSLRKTIRKIEGYAAIIDLQISELPSSSGKDSATKHGTNGDLIEHTKNDGLPRS